MKEVNVIRKKLLVVLIFASTCAHAEQGCAPGFFPGGAQPNGQICIPIPGYGTTNNVSMTQPSIPEEHWAARWGAIAIDDRNSEVGAAVDMHSKRQAEKAAIAQCQGKAGGECKVRLAYFNQCGVIAWGDTHYVTAGSATIAEASELALHRCGTASANCHIYYSACSYAERVE